MKTTLDKLKAGDKFKIACGVHTIVNTRKCHKVEYNDRVFYIDENFVMGWSTPEFLGLVEVVELNNMKKISFASLEVGGEYTSPFSNEDQNPRIKVAISFSSSGYGYYIQSQPNNIVVVDKGRLNDLVWVKK